MFIVYKLTNKVNNKIYFGYTKQSLKARFYGHHNENIIATFPNANVASKMTGVKRCNIHSCLCGKCKTASGFKWKKLAS
jgi:predicted GIY-YIG superfamily endonuclease